MKKMMDFTQNQFSKAIEYLGAVEVAPGRYAYQQNPSAPWRTFDSDALCNLALNLGPGGKGYGPWAFTLEYAEMPAWWTPEQQFAWAFEYNDCGTIRRAPGRFTDQTDAYFAGVGRVVKLTADLTTGAEVPA